MKKAFAAIAFLGLMAVAMGARASQWQEIRFGVDPSYAPFESKAANGKLIGFDIDLGNEICGRLQAKCVWIENDFDGMIPALKAKKFDGILSSLTITEARKKQIRFTDKLFNTPTRMVAKAGSGLQPTVASLKGKRVGVELGTIQETYAKTYWAPKGVDVVPYKDQNAVLDDLRAGRLDASLQDAVHADLGFLKTPQGKGFTFAGPEIKDPKTLGLGAAIGLRKEDAALKVAMDKVIADILKDGTYKKLEKKYFSFDIYGHE